MELCIQHSLRQRPVDKDMRTEDKVTLPTVFEDCSGRHVYWMVVNYCSRLSHLRDKAF
jgi:hypothetical protein